MIARERIRQRNRWCRRRQAPLLRRHWEKLKPGRDLGMRACSCWLCDPHKSERKQRLLDRRDVQRRIREELEAEAQIRAEYESEQAEGWPDDPWLERPKW